MALSCIESLTLTPVVDERSAAFIALGYALTSGQPVAIACTSGSALLNYAPALSEAFYRRVPLIVISADRPRQWIGQDDSQTIVQPGAIDNYVKKSFDIPEAHIPDDIWYANRVVNDGMLTALSGRRGPVHFNIRIGEPINATIETESTQEAAIISRKIDMLRPAMKMDTAAARELGRGIASPRKVMIVAGFMNPDPKINKALNRLSRMPNVVVLTETIANQHGEMFVSGIDAALAAVPEEKRQAICPDVVITTGGALVSRMIKTYLREAPIKEHWHVGEIDDTVDCFRKLTLRIEMSPSEFFPQLASALHPHRQESSYATEWEVLRRRSLSLTQAYAARAPWSDLKAFSTLIPRIPRRFNVHYSNGTPIRYAQIFGYHEYHRCDCNRGVSGIDGCTSTALGASLAYTGAPTLIVSGDMSAIYDISALTGTLLTPNFKMIVIDNGGGGIFRFIAATRNLPICGKLLALGKLPSVAAIGAALDMAIYEAYDEKSLRTALEEFLNDSTKAAMLRIVTPATESAEVMKDYFKFCKTH